ncbi:hypothetical protein [Marinobacterium litorale]|uniref:hypothetical protein n=1 Tax=Marinobacterium litorale TaxID=404770 RepID=UPI0004171DE2|nr:hypothetical protein [Marinobacterium litorale]
MNLNETIQQMRDDLERTTRITEHGKNEVVRARANGRRIELERALRVIDRLTTVTPAMVEAAEEAHMPFGDMEAALNAALAEAREKT